ncbi:hypothetical protein J3B02_004948 [Coemansia erecta]|nr:hypothetical protein J3B02_004948 [Coemansia erecta]
MNAENNSNIKDSSGMYSPAEPSVAGCEPPAHAAQRQISNITGYRCSHLHPMVATQAQKNPCAYMGPQMVEPLALQIEQRTTPANVPQTAGTNQQKLQLAAAIDSDGESQAEATPLATTTDTADLFSPLSTGLHDSQHLALRQLQTDTGNKVLSDETPAATQTVATDAESVYHHRLSTCQYIMTYYYMAWLTQSRFEQRAATQPVGPAAESAPSVVATTSVLNPTRSSPSMPLAEVTWFKMDTAAQVLTHETDKMALREAIHRLARFGSPSTPFAYSEVVLKQDATGHAIAKDTVAPSKPNAATGGLVHATKTTSATTTTDSAAVAMASSIDSATSSSGASSAAMSSDDGATKAETAVALPATRNMDLIRKTATSLGKRGGMLVKAARQGRASTSAGSQQSAAATAAGNRSSNADRARSSDSADAHKKAAMPRVLSIFYKFMGSSS